MDKQIERYFKQEQHGGKNRAARVLDAIMLRVLAAVGCYLWYQSNVGNRALSIALAVVTYILLLIGLKLYRSLTFDKFVIKQSEILYNTMLKEKILFLSKSEYERLCANIVKKHGVNENAHTQCFLKQSRTDEDDILGAYRRANEKGASALNILSISKLTEGAEEFCSLMPIPINIIKPEVIIEEARLTEGLCITKEELYGYIKKKQLARENTKRSMRTNPFMKSSASKYILAALILFGASFITRYALYYRMLAGVCASLGGVVVFLSKSNAGESKAS